MKSIPAARALTALALTFSTSVLATEEPIDNWAGGNRPISLTVTAPGSLPPGSILNDSGWSLDFRMEAHDWIGYLEVVPGSSSQAAFDVLILEDPDGCLDLSHTGLGPRPFTAECPGGPDELFIRFDDDGSEAAGTDDTAPLNTITTVPPDTAKRFSSCVGGYISALTDTPVTDLASQGGPVPFDQANKSYVPVDDSGFTTLRSIGPLTGSTVTDCYGYGVNDDLPGLVVMADIGGSQLVDTDLTFAPGRTRNMAGLISGVGTELINRDDRTALVAKLFVTDRMLEPLIFVDLGTLTIGTVFNITDPTFKYRIADGPVVTVSLTGSFTEGQLLEAIQAEVTSIYSVVVRAVLVNGDAPTFIDDLDGNGRFTARDVALGGYTLLSNQARVRVRLIPRELLNEEEDSYECPSNLIYTDLDGDGLNGGCMDGDGSSRSVRRVPR